MRRIVRSVVLVALVLPLVGWCALPSPWALRWVAPDRSSFMLHRVREARRADTTLTLRHDWIALEDVAPAMVQAVIVAEDHRFREHGGVDWRALGEEVRYGGDAEFSWFDGADRAALVEALRYGWDHRSEIRGRSTITMQLARNIFWTPDRSVVRKGMEVVLAPRMERWLSKDRILELYLNYAELGDGVFGVEAGAQHHFGVSASDLTRYQAASLAATLPHPRSSNPSHRPGRMAWRRDLILRRMGGEEVVIPAAPAPVDVQVQDVDPPDVSLPAGALDTVPTGTPAVPDSAALPPPDTLLPDTVGSGA